MSRICCVAAALLLLVGLPGGVGAQEKVGTLMDTVEKSESADARLAALVALQRHGGEAKTAIPAVKGALADDDSGVRLAAYHTLHVLGGSPADAAREHVRGSDARKRVNAASLLLVLGLDISETQPLLTEAIRDADPAVRFQAAFGLVQVGAAPGDTVAVLTEALKDKQQVVRERAAASLARLAGNGGGAEATPALKAALKDESPAVRRLAAYALAGLGVDGKFVLPVVAALLRDDDPAVRQQALFVIFHHYRSEAVPHLSGVLKDGNSTLRWIAAKYLGEIGPGARDAVAALEEAARDPDEAVRLQAQASLAAVRN